MTDFNIVSSKGHKVFCKFQKLSNLIKEPISYKNPENPSSIFVIWKSVILSSIFEIFSNLIFWTWSIWFHKIIVSLMKLNFQKLEPKVTFYEDFSNVSKSYIYEISVVYNLETIFRRQKPSRQNLWTFKSVVLFATVLEVRKSDFKACVRYFVTNVYLSPNDSPSKTMKDIFYFIYSSLRSRSI